MAKDKSTDKRIAALIASTLHYNPKADIELIKKAFEFASQVHKGQKRISGEEFITHPLEVAKILTELKADSATLAAALLHDVLEDTKVSEDALKKEFGDEILELVSGITKISSVGFKDSEEYNAENIRKVVLAMSKDVRVILIKLADRLHNMRTLKYLQEKDQKEMAKETLEIYAPIAYKLGIYKIKSELEDLALRYLEPEIYTELKEKVVLKRKEREKKIEKTAKNIQNMLSEKGIAAEVIGRAKHFYSIYRKMVSQGRNFNEILDLLAIRVIANTVDDCYRALGIIHSTFTPIPAHFSDYIATPKPNMYQSIHTKVIYEGEPLEIQIRTKEMHHVAEAGIAAHWRYKETERDKKFDRKISWLKQILSWKQESQSAKDFIDSLKINLFENEIIVLTPKGEPISLPEKATPIDFAYHLHTEIGNSCQKAKVNNEIVTLDHELKAGDICEIITSKHAFPSRNWLRFAKTASARAKIREFLHIKGVQKEEAGEEKKISAEITVKDKKIKKPKIAKCCFPKFGDEIVALTKDSKITIHKANCQNISGMKAIPAKWSKIGEELSTLKIVASERGSILTEILNTIADEKLDVRSINTKTKKEGMIMTAKIKSNSQDLALLKKIRKMQGVQEAGIEK